MNRCIACYRCVRFYNDYGGGDDLTTLASRGEVYFGRFEDGVLESEFSGNLVEVCPTGVFYRQDVQGALHPQVGPPDSTLYLCALQPWLQHHPR